MTSLRGSRNTMNQENSSRKISKLLILAHDSYFDVHKLLPYFFFLVLVTKKNNLDLVGRINEIKTIYCYFSKERHRFLLLCLSNQWD